MCVDGIPQQDLYGGNKYVGIIKNDKATRRWAMQRRASPGNEVMSVNALYLRVGSRWRVQR